MTDDRAALRRLSRRLKALESGKTAPAGKRRFASLALAWFLGANLFFVILPYWTWPADGPVTSRWAPRDRPGRPGISLEFHDGIDIGMPVGTRVHPVAPGIVAATGEDAVSGRWVLVRHPGGASSFYAHLSSVRLREGSLVLLPALSTLGLSGSTGRSTGPHLHLEIRQGSVSLPPGLLLAHHSARRAVLGF